MIARRIHVFLDGYGWSEKRNADVSRLKRVNNAFELPPASRNVLISFFNADSDEDLELLQAAIKELRCNITWSDEE